MFVGTSIENLIEEVKKYLKEYSDVNQKKKLREEVCETVVPDWKFFWEI